MAAIVGLSGCSPIVKNSAEMPASAPVENQSGSPISFKGEAGITALETLKSRYEVTTKSYEGLGEFVESINGLTGDATHFWAFYVDGTQASVGAGAYTATGNETIEFKFEAIK